MLDRVIMGRQKKDHLELFFFCTNKNRVHNAQRHFVRFTSNDFEIVNGYVGIT